LPDTLNAQTLPSAPAPPACTRRKLSRSRAEFQLSHKCVRRTMRL
jgi:hypothetical protein